MYVQNKTGPKSDLNRHLGDELDRLVNPVSPRLNQNFSSLFEWQRSHNQ